jgi:hypothetical protein
MTQGNSFLCKIITLLQSLALSFYSTFIVQVPFENFLQLHTVLRHLLSQYDRSRSPALRKDQAYKQNNFSRDEWQYLCVLYTAVSFAMNYVNREVFVLF